MTLPIVVAQRGRFGFGNDAGGERLRDLARQVERGDLAGLHAFDANALLDGLRGLRQHERFLQHPARSRVRSSCRDTSRGARAIRSGCSRGPRWWRPADRSGRSR